LDYALKKYEKNEEKLVRDLSLIYNLTTLMMMVEMLYLQQPKPKL